MWTGAGLDLGGNYSDDTCTGLETIVDGVSNPLLGDYAWYCGNYGSDSAKPVAQKLPNGFGLYDMHGNLFEWVEGRLSENAPSGVDPSTSGGDRRVLQRAILAMVHMG